MEDIEGVIIRRYEPEDYESYSRTRAFYRRMGFKDLRKFETDNPECSEQLIMIRKI